MNKFLVLCLILFFSSFVCGQNSRNREVRQINSYVKVIDSLIERNRFEIYADVSQTEKPRWQKFKSEAALEKYRENSETYEIAYVWRKNGKIVAANFTIFSESGDWAHYVFYRFRENGTLAKIETELRTFYGSFAAIQSFYFNQTGRLMLKTIEYRDLKNDKPIKPNKDSIKENEQYLNQINYYKRVSSLPFAFLLKKN